MNPLTKIIILKLKVQFKESVVSKKNPVLNLSGKCTYVHRKSI